MTDQRLSAAQKDAATRLRTLVTDHVYGDYERRQLMLDIDILLDGLAASTPPLPDECGSFHAPVLPLEADCRAPRPHLHQYLGPHASPPTLDVLEPAYEQLVKDHERLNDAAREACSRWFDWIDGEADQTIRKAMLKLRARLAETEEA